MKNDAFTMVAFRLPVALVEKLDRLAAETERDRSKVMRLLLQQAVTTGALDLACDREAAGRDAK